MGYTARIVEGSADVQVTRQAKKKKGRTIFSCCLETTTIFYMSRILQYLVVYMYGLKWPLLVSQKITERERERVFEIASNVRTVF